MFGIKRKKPEKLYSVKAVLSDGGEVEFDGTITQSEILRSQRSLESWFRRSNGDLIEVYSVDKYIFTPLDGQN